MLNQTDYGAIIGFRKKTNIHIKTSLPWAVVTYSSLSQGSSALGP